jgi:hypothetical protein
MHRRVGPERATDLALATSVDVTAADSRDSNARGGGPDRSAQNRTEQVPGIHFLDLRHRQHTCRVILRAACRRPVWQPALGFAKFELESSISGTNQDAIDDVLQFADISRPIVTLQRLEIGRVASIRGYDESYLSIRTPDVFARFQGGDASWEQLVPAAVAEIIKVEILFGWRPGRATPATS